MKTYLLLGGVAALLLTVHCGGGQSSSEPPSGDPDIIGTPSTLVAYQSCDELLSDLKEFALEELNETIESYASCYSYSNYGEEDMESSPSTAGDSEDSSEDSSEVSYTDTNLQETNVDESDIIKTDGSSIFVAHQSGVDVFKGWPLDQFSKIGTYLVEEGVDALFLENNQLVLISNDYDDDNRSFIQIRLLDVSTPSAPSLIGEKTLEGSTVQQRLVNNVVHVVLSGSFKDYEIELPDDFWDKQDDCESDEFQALLEEIQKESEAEIEATTIADWLPRHGEDVPSEMIDCTSFAKDSAYSEDSLGGLWSLQLSDDGIGQEQITFVKGPGYYVYASTQSVYWAATATDADATNLHRFTINTASSLHSYAGSGQVSGHVNSSSMVGTVISSFLMDESENVFRIATTVGQASKSDESSYSNVYTLDISQGDLTLLGSVENIAPGEQLYSARFIGDTGYLVTFEKIDPLFVIDVSDPSNPQLVGELEMPGFSSYIHPMDDGHIIGLGKDADDMGSFSWFQGMKLAIFDVEESSDPSIVDDLIIGSRGTDSYALTDHHAFTYDLESGLLALPLALYEGEDGGSAYGDFQYYGVHVYGLSADDGIETRAEVPLSTDNEPLRTVLIGSDEMEAVYVLDDTTLHLVDIDSEEVTASEALTDSVYGYTYVYDW